MAKVYVVTIRKYKRAFFAEPCEYDTLWRVFNSESSAIGHIQYLMRKDHEYVNSQVNAGKTYFFKGEDTQRIPEGWFVCSYGRKTNDYFESTSYKYQSYDVQ